MGKRHPVLREPAHSQPHIHSLLMQASMLWHAGFTHNTRSSGASSVLASGLFVDRALPVILAPSRMWAAGLDRHRDRALAPAAKCHQALLQPALVMAFVRLRLLLAVLVSVLLQGKTWPVLAMGPGMLQHRPKGQLPYPASPAELARPLHILHPALHMPHMLACILV